MKKHIILALSVMAAFTSCSKNDVTIPTENGIELSNVPIILGTNKNLPSVDFKSRAAVTGFDNTPVGIFALEKAGNWTSTTTTPNYSCIMNNVNATISSEGKVQLAETHYYPLDTQYNYSFYSYYPYKNNETISSNKVTVLFSDYDGQDDILWGKATATALEIPEAESIEGFNARYIRKGGATPALKFEHALASIKFYLNEGDLADNLTITNISLTSVPNDMNLIIAGSGEGTISASDFSGSYALTGEFDTSKKIYDGESEESKLGEIFFPVINDNGDGMGVIKEGNHLTGTITVKVNDGASLEQEKTATLSFNINKSTTFQKGYTYKVKITVNGPRDIVFGTAELADMKDGGSLEDVESN